MFRRLNGYLTAADFFSKQGEILNPKKAFYDDLVQFVF